MTRIWKHLISLGGLVSNPQSHGWGRGRQTDRGRERDRGETLCSFCQGQMVRAALVLHGFSLSACQAVTHTHTRTNDYLSLFALCCVWWPRLIRLIFYLSASVITVFHLNVLLGLRNSLWFTLSFRWFVICQTLCSRQSHKYIPSPTL